MKYSFITFNFGEDRVKHLMVLGESLNFTIKRDDVEYIVVEKGSSYFNQVGNSGNIKYISFGEDVEYNRSLCLNKGAEQATGEYLIFHDNDIPLPRNFFDKLDEVSNESDYFANYTQIRHLDPHMSNIVFESAKTYSFGYQYIDTPPMAIREFDKGGMYGASITMKKNLFDNIGRFDERFVGWGGEDESLHCRAMHVYKKFEIAKQNLIHLFHKPCNPTTDNAHYDENLKILSETRSNPQGVIDKLNSEKSD